jgi:hypothetical protein
MGWLIPLGASVISLFFALSLLRQWRENRSTHTFCFVVSLVMFTIAVFAEFYAYAFGWNVWIYKIYYFFAISLVSFMGAGTVYLLAEKWAGRVFLAYSIILSTLFLSQLWNVSVDMELLSNADITIGGGAILSEQVRSYSLWLSAAGGAVILAGALYSWWKTRAKGNLYIASAALIMSMGGRLAKMGVSVFLPITELIGIFLLYYGVISLQSRKKEQTLNQTLNNL